jgi:hypothetical protein
MTRSSRRLTHSLLSVVVAFCFTTLAPIMASSSFKSPARQGGVSVVYKNGETPLWMADSGAVL